MADREIDDAIAELRADLGDDVVAELIDLFEGTSQRVLAEMTAALQAGDRGELARGAHALAGTFSNFRASYGIRLSRDIESAAPAATQESLTELIARATGETERVRTYLRSAL